MRGLILLLLAVIMTTIAFAGSSTPNAEAHSLYDRRIMVQHTGKCLDVLGFGTTNGSLVVIWDCNGLPNQTWDIVQTADGYHNIKPNHAPSKCLDVLGWSQSDGTQLGIWTCDGTDKQKFTFPASGSWGDIRPKHIPGQTKCVDLLGFAVGSGSPVAQWTCNGNRNQKWYADNHWPEKRVFTDRWYQFLEDSWNYSTWMSLSGHRHYESGMQAQWSLPISNALDGYNDATTSDGDPANPGARHTVLIGDSAPASWHDVHIWASDDGNVTDAFSTGGSSSGNKDFVIAALGKVFFLDQAFHDCPNSDCDASHSRPNTWWFALVLVNKL